MLQLNSVESATHVASLKLRYDNASDTLMLKQVEEPSASPTPTNRLLIRELTDAKFFKVIN